MASTAESSDHQNPGAWRAQKVVTRPDDAADQEQPAQENGDGDGGDERDHDRQDAEHDEDDSLDQEQDPMLANRLRERALQRIDVSRVY